MDSELNSYNKGLNNNEVDTVPGVKAKSVKCYLMNQQIEPFHIQPSM